MAGSGTRKSEKQLKNIDMLTVRNVTKQEVTNVIFPNGITVGMKGAKFKNGMRIHGNAQVSGIINAQGFKVNGQDLSISGQPFIFLDVDSYAASFDDSSDATPSPTLINITVTQQGQATTLESGDITAEDSGSNPLSVTGFSVSEASTGNSTSVATLDISSLGRSSFPITITASNDGLTSTKTIVNVVGGDDGSSGTTPETLILDLDSYSVNFDDASDTSPTPSSIGITITQTGQASTIVSGDISATEQDGVTPVTISSVSTTASSTGNSVTTATIASPPTDSTKYPVTVSVNNDGRSSSKKIVSVVGGEDGAPGSTPDDGYSVILSNPSHSLYTTNAGAVTYTGSGTTISVFKGSSELNGILSGTPTTGEFSVSSVSASGITEGGRTSPGNPIICAQGSNMTQNTASIVYTLNLENLVTVQATQSLTKSVQGDDGADGPVVVPFKMTFDFASKTPRAANTVQIPRHAISSISEGFINHDETYSGSNIDEVLSVSSVSDSIQAPSTNSILNTIWYPNLSSTTGTISSITGTVVQDSSISAGSLAGFQLVFYQTDQKIASSPQNFDAHDQLRLAGSVSSQSWAASTSYPVSYTGSGITITDGMGYTFGLYTTGGTTPSSGTVVLSLQITYTGL